MPVENVHLVDFHQVQSLEDHGLREEMPGGVDHETTVRKPGPVKYVRCIQQELEKCSNFICIDPKGSSLRLKIQYKILRFCISAYTCS